MGEYDSFKPTDDFGHAKDEADFYFPGNGAMVAFGHDATPAGYPGYGPSVPPGYPHGPYLEPDMGMDGYGATGANFGWDGFHRLFGWGRREGEQLHGVWRDRRGFFARLFNRPMPPVTPVATPAPPSGFAPPPPAVAPPAAEMGWEWHDRPAPPIERGYPGQWRGAQLWADQDPVEPWDAGWGRWDHRRRGR